MQAPPELAKPAEDAWWAVRKILSENQRFLIAKKNFMEQSNALQPRSQLQPAGAIALGSLLDANALITLYVEDRQLVMIVYDAEYGRLLWQHKQALNPAQPMNEQLVTTAQKLTNQFIASIPYQGFVIVDPLIGQPSYKDKKKIFAKVEMGLNSEVNIGDEAQFIRVQAINFDPVFLEGGRVEVYAEGRVTEMDREVATVEITRMTKDRLRESALVRFPKEMARLQNYYLGKDRLATMAENILASDMVSVQTQVKEYKPLTAAVVFIANIAVFILLAL
jgi:hypothetical protein